MEYNEDSHYSEAREQLLQAGRGPHKYPFSPDCVLKCDRGVKPDTTDEGEPMNCLCVYMTQDEIRKSLHIPTR